MGRLCLNLGHLKAYQQMYTTYIIFKNVKEEENLANILLVQLKKLLWNILEFDRIFYMHGQSCKKLEFEFSSLMLSGTHYFFQKSLLQNVEINMKLCAWPQSIRFKVVSDQILSTTWSNGVDNQNEKFMPHGETTHWNVALHMGNTIKLLYPNSL